MAPTGAAASHRSPTPMVPSCSPQQQEDDEQSFAEGVRHAAAIVQRMAHSEVGHGRPACGEVTANQKTCWRAGWPTFRRRKWDQTAAAMQHAMPPNAIRGGM